MVSAPTTLDAPVRERIRQEARIAGLARSRLPSLSDVEGRRLQLWGLASVVLLGMAAAVGLSAGPGLQGQLAVPPEIVRLCSAALALAFCAYTIEKEVHLRRLARLLVEEQMRGLALQSEVDRLLEIARIRSDLIAAVSHDLRTPVTAIRGAAELLRTPLPPGDRTALLDALDRQSRHLQSMVEQLLIASVLERDGPPLDLTTIDLVEVVREVARDLAAARRPVHLEAPQRAHVRASAEGLRRVVENLVTNAYLHGRPPIGIRILEAAGMVVLTVADAGRGVRPADRRRVFELFTRLDPSRNGPGMGLGLGIVQGLAGAWGGRVWVDDAPEGGAAFHVALPAAPSTAVPAASAH
ncbi:MAG: HAMP domain-containing sensor histidine kinase [Actinomycetota bacterium]